MEKIYPKRWQKMAGILKESSREGSEEWEKLDSWINNALPDSDYREIMDMLDAGSIGMAADYLLNNYSHELGSWTKDELTEYLESRPESMDDLEYEDDMDGDAESALASAGLGTDEDYGYYGERDDDW